MAEADRERASMRTVVAASSAGTAFEWYDFFIFGSLTQVISKTFFAGLNDTAGYIAALALFGVGFAFRPLGALVFGKIGDQAGRKGAFLATVLLMGGATFAIAFLPTYQQAGIISPILLILMRCVQGFALGGEYGGAAIYVAEHSPVNKRGWSTSWVQTSAAFGLFGALLVIMGARAAVGVEAFDAWGWRIPFAVSIGLLGVSVWMRMKLTESPAFVAMKEEGQASKAPYAEAFGQWKNLKLVILAFLSMMCAQGAVWYTSFFYVQTFMEKFLKVDAATINGVMMTATAISAVFYVVFGWLSDRIGRKPVMLGGMTLALLFYFPGFHLLEKAANPALAEASAKSPVVVVADPKDCSLQFDPVGKTAFVTSCDIIKSALANAGVSYANQKAPAGSVAVMKIGGAEIVSQSAKGLSKAEVKAVKTGVETRIKAALAAAGYPAKADPARMNKPLMLGVLFVFVIGATALFGPLAACLVELFPTRVRYTALSLPYHIGTGWVGGFVPFFAFAIVTAVGNIYAGLWYPIAFTLISVLTTAFLLPETKGRSLD
ncbi:MFS transporter [Caulobacter sp. 602-1]|uniref:MFS transporter n=1 Tax=Caulobacter sp. 602-1 TaxID=2492472 RepID=UPI000F63EA48|nr:MFS transporter [Caulobacter sp. 602-1]RRN64849.1 MFS transporter [Caulobacter sp. 602-1]